MRALHRRWKLALIVFALISGGLAFFSPLTVALACGLVLGVGLILLLEALDRTVKTVDDVRVKLGLAVLGTLPRVSRAGMPAAAPERQLFTGLSPGDPAVEAYRALRTGIESRLDKTRHRLIMITSCIPGEGKSTVSGNLAAVLGQTGVKVLLVGCDLRRPTLGEMFGQPREPGLTELLVKGDQSALRSLTDPPIDFMSGGSIPHSPAELLDSKEMRDFLEYAGERYDYVIIDAPPVLPITDAQLLAPHCDMLLVVVEPCRTQIQMVQQLKKTLQAVGEEVDGVILNDKSGLAARFYGNGGDYGLSSVGPGAVPDRSREPLPEAPVRPWPYRIAGVTILTVAAGAFFWMALRDDIVGPADRSVPTVPPVSLGRVTTAPPVAPALKPVSEQYGVSSPPTAIRETLRSPGPPPAPVAATPRAANTLSRTEPPTDLPALPVAVGEVAIQGGAADEMWPALAAVAMAWQKPPIAGRSTAAGDPADSFVAMGLQSSPLGGDLAALLQLNAPLLLQVRPEEAGQSWIAVVGRKGFKWLVSPQPRQGGLLSEIELKRLWTGQGHLPWHDPLQLASLNAGAANPDLIAGLQQLLAKAGCLRTFEPGVYDRETLKAIGTLQATGGLPVNGRITPETLILLYQADPAFQVPKFPLWH